MTRLATPIRAASEGMSGVGTRERPSWRTSNSSVRFLVTAPTETRASKALRNTVSLRRRVALQGLYEHCGDMPPAEMEHQHYAQQQAKLEAELSNG